MSARSLHLKLVSVLGTIRSVKRRFASSSSQPRVNRFAFLLLSIPLKALQITIAVAMIGVAVFSLLNKNLGQATIAAALGGWSSKSRPGFWHAVL